MKWWPNTWERGRLARLRIVVALLATALFLPAAPVTEEAYQRVASRLVCQCGCGQSVAACNHRQCSSAETLRSDVREAISKTPNEERAVESLVLKWGLKLLAEPPRSGFNLAAWVTPFVALAAGVFIVAAVLRHWRRQTLAATSGVDPHLLARYQSGIDEETEKG